MTHSDLNDRAQKVERFALRLSPVGYLVFGLLGVGFFLWSGSEAILLDGAYSLISLVMALGALRVSRLVRQKDSKRFPFGYAHFEPIINTLRVAVILGVDLFAVMSAVAALSNGGRPLDTGPAVIYGVLSAAVCIAMSVFQRRSARIADSPVLRVDARSWFVDGMISSGVGLTFLLGAWLEGGAYASWVPFLDPVLVIVLVVVSLPFTLTSLKENLPQMLQASPPESVREEVHAHVKDALSDFDYADFSVRMINMGRTFYTLIHVVVPKGVRQLDVAQCDALRSDIVNRVSHINRRPVADVVFTAERDDLLGV